MGMRCLWKRKGEERGKRMGLSHVPSTLLQLERWEHQDKGTWLSQSSASCDLLVPSFFDCNYLFIVSGLAFLTHSQKRDHSRMSLTLLLLFTIVIIDSFQWTIPFRLTIRAVLQILSFFRVVLHFFAAMYSFQDAPDSSPSSLDRPGRSRSCRSRLWEGCTLTMKPC